MLAEQYLITDLASNPSRWIFDATGGVNGYQDTDVPYVSGRGCLRCVVSASAQIYIATVPGTSNPPFTVASDGRIQFASRTVSPEISVRLLFNSPNPGGGTTLMRLFFGNFFLVLGGGAIIIRDALSAVNITSISVSANTWYDVRADLKFTGTNFLYRLTRTQLNVDGNGNYIGSNPPVSNIGTYSPATLPDYVLSGYYIFLEMVQIDLRVDYIRLFQGTGVSGL